MTAIFSVVLSVPFFWRSKVKTPTDPRAVCGVLVNRALPDVREAIVGGKGTAHLPLEVYTLFKGAREQP